MATKPLDSRKMKELQPAYSLWKRYRPAHAPFAFHARDLKDAQAWQRRTRKELERILGLLDIPKCPLQVRLIERVNKGDYIREKIVLQTAPHVLMPAYLLIPKAGPKPLPSVLALHGHGYGVKDIVGLWEDGRERSVPDGCHKDFAVALCRKGFAVAAPEISCFGERQTDFSYLDTVLGQSAPATCTHTAVLASHLGLSAAGLRVHDARRLVDYLKTRPEFDGNRLGVMGISGGGMHTFFSTCVDTRIRACVISGYYSTFRDSILAMAHCTCNFVPGLYRFGEMYDLVGLIAPRPVLVEAGTRDPIFPLAAVKRSVARTRQVYNVFGAAGNVETDIFEGRHQISGRRAYDFLLRKLKANP
jgi:dienelactone hydrolase